MCPLCITTVALSAAGVASGAGAAAVATSRWQTVLRWLRSRRAGRSTAPGAI